MLRSLIFGLVFLRMVSPAPASDLPFGADGLSYLTREAAWIVISGTEAVPLPRGDARVDLYEVSVSQQLVGEGARARLRVAVPRTRPEQDGSDSAWLQSSVLFLYPPMTDEQRQFWRVGAGLGEIRMLVSGRLGARPEVLEGGIELAPFVRQGRGASSVQEQLELIDRLLVQDNAFLQRSAVLELMETSTSLLDEEVLKRIEKVLVDPGLDVGARSTGLQVYRMAAPPDVEEKLRAIVGDLTAPSLLRHQAASALREVNPSLELARPERPADIDKLGADALDRQDLEQLTRYLESDQIPMNRKLELLGEIERHGGRAGAVGLLFVGSSDELPAELRSRALQGLTDYSPEVRSRAFQDLEAEAASHGPEATAADPGPQDRPGPGGEVGGADRPGTALDARRLPAGEVTIDPGDDLPEDLREAIDAGSDAESTATDVEAAESEDESEPPPRGDEE